MLSCYYAAQKFTEDGNLEIYYKNSITDYSINNINAEIFKIFFLITHMESVGE